MGQVGVMGDNNMEALQVTQQLLESKFYKKLFVFFVKLGKRAPPSATDLPYLGYTVVQPQKGNDVDPISDC